MGCQVVTELPVRHSGKVERLVLVGPTPDPGARTPLRHIGRWLLDATRERPSMALIQGADLWQAGLLRGWRTFRSMRRHRIEEVLPDVRAPTFHRSLTGSLWCCIFSTC